MKSVEEIAARIAAQVKLTEEQRPAQKQLEVHAKLEFHAIQNIDDKHIAEHPESRDDARKRAIWTIAKMLHDIATS